ncbi:MAG TPA: DUF6132 family protein [Candidatus Omnitrophota bacterium]|nr:DUF6132 family protein [Candidatus Omnitrophota bacterium]
MRVVLGAAIGAVIGFGVGYFGKCSSGMCPLTSNPWISTFVGALFGFMFMMGR